MNPFKMASSMGFGPDQILQYLMGKDPDMGKKIQTAIAAGFTSQQILNYLQKSVGDSEPAAQSDKQDPRTARVANQELSQIRQARAEDETSALEDFLAPGRAIGTIGGAVLGGMVGGPAGAIQGAAAGHSAYQSLLGDYNKRVQRGESLSLSDYLKAMAKGAGGAAMARVAMDMLTRMAAAKRGSTDPQGDREAQQLLQLEGPEDIPTEETSAPDEPGPIAPVADTEGQAEQDKDAQAYAIMRDRLNPNIADSLLGQIDDPRAIARGIANNFGQGLLREMASDAGMKPKELAERALRHYRYGVGSVPTESVETGIESVDAGTKSVDSEAQSVSTITLPGQSDVPEMDQFTDVISSTFSGLEGRRPSPQEIREVQSSPSSNLAFMDYDPDDQVMHVLFNPSLPRIRDRGIRNVKGKVYRYENVPPDSFDKVLTGAGIPKTTGGGKFGFHFAGADPSIGAAFHEEIRSRPEEFPYSIVEPTTEAMKAVQEGDMVQNIVSKYIQPFEDLQIKGSAKLAAPKAKAVSKVLREYDDATVEYMLAEVARLLRAASKRPSKRFIEQTERYAQGVRGKDVIKQPGKGSSNKKARQSKRE